MAIGDRRRHKVTEIVSCHFEQTAKHAGFPIESLLEVMAETVKKMPQASDALLNELDEIAPEDMVDPILAATSKRKEQINVYLNGQYRLYPSYE